MSGSELTGAAAAAAAACVSTMDLSALSGPAEVAIGIAVAYLGFDRFRYKARAHDVVAKLSDDVKPQDVLKAALSDGNLNGVEKGMLSIYYYTVDGEFKKLLDAHKSKIVADNYFWRTIERFLLDCIVKKKLDRRIVTIFLFALCAWELILSWILFGNGNIIAPKYKAAFEWSYYAFIVFAYAAPGACFLSAEWMMHCIRSAVSDWRSSIMADLAKKAQDAALGPNGTK